jgi:hypothetical protein
MIEHDRRPCTPSGHSAYRGYDAFKGKMADLYGITAAAPNGAPRCEHCGKWFGTARSLSDHMAHKHGVAA